MALLTYTKIKDLYLSKGYKFREEKMALNPFGIRTLESKSNKFDDVGGVAWIDENNEKQLFLFAMTTDPGKYYLQNPMNKDGTIILVPGQYKECYGRGLHNGKYECFKQARNMYYVRDNDRNITLDFSLYRDPEKLKKHGFWGMNGTNLHRASEYKIVQWVERYSAGCQVVQRPDMFKKLMELRDSTIPFGFTLWDYTLFEEYYDVKSSDIELYKQLVV